MKSLVGLQAKARRGDPYAFGELITLWDEDLRGVVWSVVRSAVDTDDVMQAAYEKAFRSIESFRQEASMKTWLHAVCYRTALDHVRYEGRRQHGSTESLHNRAGEHSASNDAIAKADLSALLEQLDPEVRALLMLTVGLGFTFDETAEITGLARGTVASKVGRAKKTLRTLTADQSSTPDSEERA